MRLCLAGLALKIFEEHAAPSRRLSPDVPSVRLLEYRQVPLSPAQDSRLRGIHAFLSHLTVPKAQRCAERMLLGRIRGHHDGRCFSLLQAPERTELQNM